MRAEAEQQQFRAAEARRLSEEPLLVEALDKLEQDAMEEALGVPQWHRWGRARRDLLLQRITVIRDLRTSLAVTIAVGAQAARRGA